MEILGCCKTAYFPFLFITQGVLCKMFSTIIVYGILWVLRLYDYETSFQFSYSCEIYLAELKVAYDI